MSCYQQLILIQLSMYIECVFYERRHSSVEVVCACHHSTVCSSRTDLQCYPPSNLEYGTRTVKTQPILPSYVNLIIISSLGPEVLTAHCVPSSSLSPRHSRIWWWRISRVPSPFPLLTSQSIIILKSSLPLSFLFTFKSPHRVLHVLRLSQVLKPASPPSFSFLFHHPLFFASFTQSSLLFAFVSTILAAPFHALLLTTSPFHTHFTFTLSLTLSV
jgi:hypothetical protein